MDEGGDYCQYRRNAGAIAPFAGNKLVCRE
jgi:hypothetical protein